MNPRRLVLASSLLALAALSVGQSPVGVAPSRDTAPASADTAPRPFAASYAFDVTRKGKPLQVASYAVRTFHLDTQRGDFAVDLRGIVGLGPEVTLGTGLTHTWTWRPTFVREFRPKIDLTLGPWINYGAASGKLRGGLFLGVGGSF